MLSLPSGESNSGTYITKPGYYASGTEDNLEQFLVYINNDDQVNINNMINSARVFKLAPYKDVYLIKSNLGLVKIKPKGKDYEMWTFLEAIDQK
jgi:hypothetical protein